MSRALFFSGFASIALVGTLSYASVPLPQEQPAAPSVRPTSAVPMIPELDATSVPQGLPVPYPTSDQSERPGRHVLDLIVLEPGRFALVNVSRRSQRVLPALDGSDMGWRMPKVMVEWRDAVGEPVSPRRMSRCGNMNALRPQDWVTLAPGEQLELTNGWVRAEPPPGAVEMRLVYDTMSPSSRPFGDGKGDPEKAFAELPEGVWTSAWTKVPWKGFPR